MLQGALNGSRTRADHAGVPIAAQELAEDAAACVAAGARSFHVHPRDGDGRETLEAAAVDAVARAIRTRAGVPVGVSTAEWIEPDLERRVALVAAWREPDFASVNLAEPGHAEVMRALLTAGVGIEAGVWSVEDAERLAATGLADRVTRVLVEPWHDPDRDLLALVGELHAALDRHGIAAPRLQHGDDASTWLLLRDAVARGADTRVGLEDVLHDPDGAAVAGNADLVSAARALGAL